jgi:hypothetical protein
MKNDDSVIIHFLNGMIDAPRIVNADEIEKLRAAQDSAHKAQLEALSKDKRFSQMLSNLQRVMKSYRAIALRHADEFNARGFYKPEAQHSLDERWEDMIEIAGDIASEFKLDPMLDFYGEDALSFLQQRFKF